MSEERNNKHNQNEMKRLTVDPNLCIGCGLCVTTCPDVFELGDDGKSRVKNAAACEKCNCQEAIDGCPAKAINWKADGNSPLGIQS